MADFTVNGNINDSNIDRDAVESAIEQIAVNSEVAKLATEYIETAQRIISEQSFSAADTLITTLKKYGIGSSGNRNPSRSVPGFVSKLSESSLDKSTNEVLTKVASDLEKNNPEIFSSISSQEDTNKALAQLIASSVGKDKGTETELVAKKAYELATAPLTEEESKQIIDNLNAQLDAHIESVDNLTQKIEDHNAVVGELVSGNETIESLIQDAVQQLSEISDPQETVAEEPLASAVVNAAFSNGVDTPSENIADEVVKAADDANILSIAEMQAALDSIGQSVKEDSGLSQQDIYNEQFGLESPLDRPAQALVEASENLIDASQTLEDAVNNEVFSPGNGNGGGDGPPEPDTMFPEDDGEEPESQIDKILSGIAGKAGKLTVAAYLGKLVNDTFQGLLNVVQGQLAYYSNAAVASIGTPQAVSPVQATLQPIVGAGQAIGTMGGLAGAGLGTLIAPGIGTIAGGVLGTIIGDKFSASISGVVDILTSIDDGIQNLANELAPYSPDIIIASIEGEIARLESRFRQAEELGPLLAENIQARTEFELAIRELGTDLAKLFLPILTNLTNIGTNIVEVINNNFVTIVERFRAAINVVYSSLNPYLRSVFDAMLKVLNIISTNTKPNQQTSSAINQIDQFIQQSATSRPSGSLTAGGVGPSFPYFTSMGVNF